MQRYPDTREPRHRIRARLPDGLAHLGGQVELQQQRSEVTAHQHAVRPAVDLLAMMVASEPLRAAIAQHRIGHHHHLAYARGCHIVRVLLHHAAMPGERIGRKRSERPIERIGVGGDLLAQSAGAFRPLDAHATAGEQPQAGAEGMGHASPRAKNVPNHDPATGQPPIAHPGEARKSATFCDIFRTRE